MLRDCGAPNHLYDLVGFDGGIEDCQITYYQSIKEIINFTNIEINKKLV